jgi:hypothetical protein
MSLITVFMGIPLPVFHYPTAVVFGLHVIFTGGHFAMAPGDI